MNVGMIGLSPENGHPFSFSAIINGYDKANFSKSGWEIILNYLEKNKSNLGVPPLKVTHAWTQDFEVTKILTKACKIDNACRSIDDMINEVQAVIIARDDERSHFELAKPFLEIGKYVFIDKPLTLDENELIAFKPYLQQGKLMSTSGFRFASELEEVRIKLKKIGELKIISAVVVNDFVKYGVHILDAISSLGVGNIIRITRLFCSHEAYSFLLDTGVVLNLNCLGRASKIFKISFYGSGGFFDCDLKDNFTAFKNTLKQFSLMIKFNRPVFSAESVCQVIKTLQVGAKLSLGSSVEVL